MIRDITIGQYYPADSVLHKMDPRAKLVGTLVFIISVFVFHTFPGYAVATIFLAAMIILSKVPVKFMFKGLKAIVMLLMITVVFNIFLTPGKVLWQWGILHVTEEGLKLAGRMAIRLTYLVSAFRRANDLAMAMEARCYHGGDNRTQMKPLRYESRDYISYVVMWAYLGIAIVFRIVGI